MSLTRGGWSCTVQDGSIGVRLGSSDVGAYSLLEQPFCGVCSAPGVETNACAKALYGHHELHGFRRLYAVGAYYPRRTLTADLLTAHILALKDSVSFASPLGMALALCLERRYPELLSSDVISPMPQHPDKVKRRGYNQALELANVLSWKTGIPVVEPLEKTRDVSSTGKRRDEIKAMMSGLYVANTEASELVSGKSALVVDDTATTGFDLAECSEQLMHAGCNTVNVYVVGRTAWSF